MNAVELEKLTVVQLREQLKTRGLATAGNKPALVQRLIDSFNSEEKILQSGSISSEDPDLEQIAEEDVLGIETPAKKPEVRGAAGGDAKVISPKAATKKDETNGDALKKIALNQAPTVQVLTAPERKLERAKKFNIQPQLSVDEAKKLRAERFGAQQKDKAGKLAATGVAQDPEALKKRAERFGIPVKAAASTEASSETEAMKQKRAERFGGTKAPIIPVDDEKILKRRERFGAVGVSSEEVSAKKQKRADRFGTK